jgi:hypothetical protein
MIANRSRVALDNLLIGACTNTGLLHFDRNDSHSDTLAKTVRFASTHE